MFLINLNSEQQSALIHSANEVMLADGISHKRQLIVLELLRKEANPDIQDRDFSFDELASLFQSNREKSAFLLELIGVALCDGEWHEKEDTLIKKYSECLEVSDKKLTTLKEWVGKQFILIQEAEELME